MFNDLSAIRNAKASELFDDFHILVYDTRTKDLIGTNSNFHKFGVGFETLPYFEAALILNMAPGTINLCTLSVGSEKKSYSISKKESEGQIVYTLIPFLSNTEAIESLKAELSNDLLTGLRNRKYSLAQVEEEHKKALKGLSVSSFLMIDIDHFKKINDTYGHDAGDGALKHCASVIMDCLRSDDTAGRMGGEEFLIILPGTGISGASVVAHKILSAIEKRPYNYKDRAIINMTVSIGISFVSSFFRGEIADILKNADEALYAAKSNGRNCCEILE